MDKNDIVDIIEGVLRGASVRETAPPASGARRPADEIIVPESTSYKTGTYARSGYNKPYTTLKAGRRFVSEYDVRVMLGSNPREINVPKNAIISPLAEDILQEKNIKINYV